MFGRLRGARRKAHGRPGARLHGKRLLQCPCPCPVPVDPARHLRTGMHLSLRPPRCQLPRAFPHFNRTRPQGFQRTGKSGKASPRGYSAVHSPVRKKGVCGLTNLCRLASSHGVSDVKNTAAHEGLKYPGKSVIYPIFRAENGKFIFSPRRAFIIILPGGSASWSLHGPALEDFCHC